MEKRIKRRNQKRGTSIRTWKTKKKKRRKRAKGLGKRSGESEKKEIRNG